MNPNFTRRSWLRGAAGLSAALAAQSTPFAQLARAAGPAGPVPRHFVFVYFSGGWDILLSLDPRDPTVFTDAQSAVTRIQPGYDLLDDPTNDGSPIYTSNGTMFGPYLGDLAKHADKLAVVRGMSMDTLTHEVGRRRFITGKPPSGLLARGSSAATWLASILGGDDPVPNIAIRVESYNADQPNYATGLSVSRVPDLVRAFRPADPQLDPTVDAVIDSILAERAECGSAKASPMLQMAEAGRQKARDMASKGYDALFDFQGKTEAMAALRQHYGIAATGAAALDTPEAQAAAAATALTAGISRVVSYAAASGLDTHYDEWTTDHGPIQRRGFNTVARLVEDLQSREYGNTGSSWFDHTVIVGFSEFSRTPMLNTRLGRDHHLNNSCFLLGGPIRGATVIGASTDVGMLPQPVNLATGLVDPGGEIVRPEHVLQTLFHEIGVTDDRADLRASPITALLK